MTFEGGSLVLARGEVGTDPFLRGQEGVDGGHPESGQFQVPGLHGGRGVPEVAADHVAFGETCTGAAAVDHRHPGTGVGGGAGPVADTGVAHFCPGRDQVDEVVVELPRIVHWSPLVSGRVTQRRSPGMSVRSTTLTGRS